MCGRFTLTTDDYAAVAEAFGARVEPEVLAAARPRFNVAPTDRHPIVVADPDARRLVLGQWGLKSLRDRDKPRPPIQINARAETVASRGLFRSAFERHRCVVVADGFFEWTGPKHDRRPMWFHPPGGGPLAFAGIFLPWPGDDGPVPCFCIVTTAANDLVAPVHDRMPVVLAAGDVDAWLDGRSDTAALQQLLRPAPDDRLIATPVSPRVNDVRNDDPGCLAAPAELPGIS